MNPHHQAFLDAIFKDPENDFPRLVYAEWLDEQGDPRGEFIRIQCELAKRVNNKEKAKEYVDIGKSILNQYGQQWIKQDFEIEAKLPASVQIIAPFHRGFPLPLTFKIPAYDELVLRYRQAPPNFPWSQCNDVIMDEFLQGNLCGNWEALVIHAQESPQRVKSELLGIKNYSFATLDHLLLFVENHSLFFEKLPYGLHRINKTLISLSNDENLQDAWIINQGLPRNSLELRSNYVGTEPDLHRDLVMWWSASTNYYLLIKRSK